MLRFLKLTLLLSLAPALGAESEIDLQPDDSFAFKTVGDIELKLHVFYPEEHRQGDKRPAIVFFFGGGWRKGSPDQFYPHCEYLASRGMVAIAPEYRVSERHGTTPQECVADGKSAMRWVRQHASELGLDPQRIAAGGGSAGGHVATATAIIDDFNEPGEPLFASSRPDALVLFNPVFDNGPDGYGYERVKGYWERFSPLHNINQTIPPTLVLLGTHDKLIPVETAELFKEETERHGQRCDLHLYAGQEHGFFNYRHTTYYTMTVVEMDRFLASLGYLEGEPSLHVTIDPASER
ncbi:alpha/beta hydrolase [Pelagicoccus enzymogenes]|uniref:alpha/beta hydrolase n=1 Tax=Pelagicoccus enzymogenes TaxID=2773457 RepID=UPI00280C5BCC|nr:alpha/beta hydrolase [Pelagicoccus enzymogenes]MDQ8200533.1 alpha/beta hydrolase [Pelagicoccus enzymogenes]